MASPCLLLTGEPQPGPSPPRGASDVLVEGIKASPLPTTLLTQPPVGLRPLLHDPTFNSCSPLRPQSFRSFQPLLQPIQVPCPPASSLPSLICLRRALSQNRGEARRKPGVHLSSPASFEPRGLFGGVWGWGRISLIKLPRQKKEGAPLLPAER